MISSPCLNSETLCLHVHCFNYFSQHWSLFNNSMCLGDGQFYSYYVFLRNICFREKVTVEYMMTSTLRYHGNRCQNHNYQIETLVQDHWTDQLNWAMFEITANILNWQAFIWIYRILWGVISRLYSRIKDFDNWHWLKHSNLPWSTQLLHLLQLV